MAADVFVHLQYITSPFVAYSECCIMSLIERQETTGLELNATYSVM